MLEVLKSITEKINIINNARERKNSSIKKVLWFKYHVALVILLSTSPFMSLFFLKEKAVVILINILFFFISYVSLSIGFYKRLLFKLLNEKEKEILKKSRIDLTLLNKKNSM